MSNYRMSDLASVQESEIEAIRQRLTLEKITRPLQRYAAIGAVAGAGLALSATLTVNLINGISYANTLREIEVDNTHMDELRTNMDRLNESAGEACVSVLRAYISGGTLANTDENTVVDDLSGDTRKPCGDTPTRIRTTLRPIRDTDKNITDQQSKIDKEKSKIENHNEGNSTQYIILGSLGLIMGAVVGSGIKWCKLDSSYTPKNTNYIYQRDMNEGVFYEYRLKEKALDMRGEKN